MGLVGNAPNQVPTNGDLGPLAFRDENPAGAVVVDTSGVIPVVTNIRIGARSDGAANFNGTIKRITYFPKRLPNYQLQILTK